MNILFLIGVTLFLGAWSSKLVSRFKIPQVTGYLIVGVFLGQAGLKIWTPALIESFSPFVQMALGLIGFMIGSELKLDLFKHRGRSIYAILVFEGIMAFFVVGALVTLVTHEIYLGLLFGALAAATAPAATVDVLWEYKTRGPLTSTLLAIVALDDVLGLVLYAFAGAFAKSLITREHFSWLHTLEAPFIEIGLAVLIGVTGGIILHRMIYFIRQRERILPFSLGVIILTVAAAIHFNVDLIISSMILGMTLVNLAPRESEEITQAIQKFSPPLYILFFVLVGARLDPGLFFAPGVALLVGLYILGRTTGKMSGAYLGGVIGKAPAVVRKYLGLCLFSQAGVAIGMAISLDQYLSHLGPEAAQIGHLIINVIVITTFIVQVIGPPSVRLGVAKAGEMWRNVTEEDVIEEHKIADLIEKGIPVIKENTPLEDIVRMVKTSESNNFCVVDQENKLLGYFSLGDLRMVLLEYETGLTSLVVAKDIAIPAVHTVLATRPLKEAIEILRRRELDFLPVVSDEKTKEFIGVVHYRHAMDLIHKELVARRGVE